MRRFLSVLFVAVAAIAVYAADPEYKPTVKPASDEGEAAIKRFQVDKSLKVELWAAEPMLANPVCFCFDEKGRCYVAETFRHSAGATDNRSHKWLDDELACRTVEDRVRMFREYAKDKFTATYEKERDRVRLIEDTTGSGKADKSTVFRDDFGNAEDGIGAGLLARYGNVYFTNIPSLYMMKDTKGDGKADVKEVLSTGYGVHVAFIGHDLHGLRMGPDGRIYFSIGDRGLNVKTKEGKHLFYPDTGAVLRCEPDGSNLEVVHIGLRNPQELAFDDHGNLFTVDNNSDSGDRARFVYIVEGGDSGWRIGYQYGSSMHDSTVKQGNRGPWNYEKLWQPAHEGQPAYITPTYTNFSDGPSGLTHYPGIGLSDKFKNRFFLCDFRGNSGGSGVWTFTAKPKGAGFELADPQKFAWNVLATDCDFGPDCNLYISDWTEGWNKPGKGRIYKVVDAEAQKNEAIAETRKLLSEPFSGRPIGSLVKLLEHSHQQVRMEAQFALAAKGKDGIEPLAKVAKESRNRLARLHALWGIGQIARADWRDDSKEGVDRFNGIQKILLDVSRDTDPEVRANAAKVMREGSNSGHVIPSENFDRLVMMLADPEARVKYFAAQTLGHPDVSQRHTGAKMPRTEEQLRAADRAIKQLIQDAGDKDPYLRRVASRAVSLYSELDEDVSHPSSLVRIASILATRSLLPPAAASWAPAILVDRHKAHLDDTDPRVIAEAARMAHDLQIPNLLPKLATLTARQNLENAVLYRALNANFLLGKPENAAALATFAARPNAPANLRVLALQMLGSWPKPPRRDFITGLTQNLPPRDPAVAAAALKAKLAGVFSGPAEVQKEAANVAGKLGISGVGPFLFDLVKDAKASATTRVEAINALDALKEPKLGEAIEIALASNDPRFRNAGRAILLKSKPSEAIQQLKTVLAGDNTAEKQGALAILADVKTAEVDDLLAVLLDHLNKNDLPAELQLDVIEAAGKRQAANVKSLLKQYEAGRPKGDDLAAWRETLVGGDAARGRDVFLNKAAVACQRCHKLDGEGGEVGPPLNGLGGKQKRDYLLEAIVLPNKQIAKGYDSVIITTADGKNIAGVLKSEDAKEVKVMTAEGQLITIKKDDIDERRATKTAMPEDVAQKLTKQEIRDLVEFLAGLKEEWKK